MAVSIFLRNINEINGFLDASNAPIINLISKIYEKSRPKTSEKPVRHISYMFGHLKPEVFQRFLIVGFRSHIFDFRLVLESYFLYFRFFVPTLCDTTENFCETKNKNFVFTVTFYFLFCHNIEQ